MFGGFDFMEIGTLKSRYGGWVGIPINYVYNSSTDIEKGDIRVGQTPVKWNTSNGELLENSLVLTEDEQIFGISRSILELRSWKMGTELVFPVVTLLGMYSIAINVNQKFNLYAKHRAVRVGLYQLILIFGAGVYCFLTDFTQMQRDEEIDNKLASLGPGWCDAGARYYSKLLNKNVAIREISGNDLYTAKGNIHYFIRQKSLPLTDRKRFFEKKLKEYRESSEKIESETAFGDEQPVQLQ